MKKILFFVFCFVFCFVFVLFFAFIFFFCLFVLFFFGFDNTKIKPKPKMIQKKKKKIPDLSFEQHDTDFFLFFFTQSYTKKRTPPQLPPTKEGATPLLPLPLPQPLLPPTPILFFSFFFNLFPSFTSSASLTPSKEDPPPKTRNPYPKKEGIEVVRLVPPPKQV